MKDNISIIFAAIIGVLLIVILPLFSILDRQDSMSYNVVLTETTKFVDNIRNNGFIDNESYTNYISALASTSNTYKVDMEIYRKRLIKDVDSGLDTYIEDVELFNTTDVLEVIQGDSSVENAESSNQKNNVYLLKENDEVYFKVYNTNITAGSIMYKSFSRIDANKVIDISYGGVVNNINWELFNKINASAVDVPEVLMEVPLNANNKTNIMKVNSQGDIEEIDCDVYPELCEDGVSIGLTEQYTYLYDLTYTANRKMTIAVELKNVDYIVIGENADGSLKLASLESLTEQQFNLAKDYIIDNFIQLNEMIADVDLQYRGKQEYYTFNIILNNIEISAVNLLSAYASVSVLPGLGQDVGGTISLGAESVKVELVDEASVHTVVITDPINWKKLLQTGNVSTAIMTSGEVYVGQEIAFLISYVGIDNSQDIKTAVKNNLTIYGALYEDLEILTVQEVKATYGVNLSTRTVGHILVKFKYITANTNSTANYININSGWIATNTDIEPGTPQLASGAQSSKYAVWLDNGVPVAPIILTDGVMGNNGWYIKDNINISLQKSKTDTIIKGTKSQIGGSGVEKNTLTLNGNTQIPETQVTEYLIENEGVTHVIARAYDYVGNVSTSQVAVKLDKTAPQSPNIVLSGNSGRDGWYNSNVTIDVVGTGKDDISGVEKTTYKLNGVQTRPETDIPQSGRITLTENGLNIVTITTYDKAGNSTEKVLQVYIDKTIPAGVDFGVTSGSKNLNGWYNTDVKVKISVKDNVSPSGLAKVEYTLIGTDGGASVKATTITDKTKEITITQSGKYTLKVNTYSGAGNVKTQEYTFSIDKEAPNLPTIAIYSTIPVDNGWYKDSVRVTMTSNQDVGPSTEQSFSYTVTTGGVSSARTEIKSPTITNIANDGIYVYDVYSLDYASNESHAQSIIRVDKTLPTSADFVITGKKGLDNWYVSDVNISYTGGSDATSGIKGVTLSTNSITQDTLGTEVTMTTEDNAGNKVVKTTTIKLDKTLPTAPVINLPLVTGAGIAGVNLYNKGVDITITPGIDNNIDRTTYKVIDRQTGDEIVSETTQTTLNLTNNGKYEVVTNAYDKAGNKSTSSKVIWINKDKPQSPRISSVNGQPITNSTTQTVTGTSSTLNIVFANVEVGSKLNVVLIQENTYDKKETQVQVTDENQLVTIKLDTKGTYRITATQTNMYGTESDVNVGSYDYEYK